MKLFHTKKIWTQRPSPRKSGREGLLGSRVPSGITLFFALLPAIASVIAPAGSEALELSATEWELGMRWIGNEEELEDVDPDSSGSSSKTEKWKIEGVGGLTLGADPL
ncbi:MAG: hypothetical protein R6V67_09690, partial [Spirochaetia bacterium]